MNRLLMRDGLAAIVSLLTATLVVFAVIRAISAAAATHWDEGTFWLLVLIGLTLAGRDR